MIFLYEYEHGGKKWGLEIEANDWQDAVNKMESIKNSLIINGELVEVIPVWEKQINKN